MKETSVKRKKFVPYEKSSKKETYGILLESSRELRIFWCVLERRTDDNRRWLAGNCVKNRVNLIVDMLNSLEN